MPYSGFSDNSSSHKTLISARYGDVADWSGQQINKKIFEILQPGDIVRATVTRIIAEDGRTSRSSPYFEITKIKDGTFWGKAKNTYWTLDFLDSPYLQEGDIYPFRKEHIIEVPITWQSKAQQRKMEPLLVSKRPGCGITGLYPGR